MSIEIKKIGDLKPEEALSLPASQSLDKYMFDTVLEGPQDVPGELPLFSKKMDQCMPILIQLMMEGGEMSISVDPKMYQDALSGGFVTPGRPTSIWRAKNSRYVGYGRNMPEAICKLSICEKFRIKR